MSALHGESVVMFPGRKLKKTYLNSESILHLEDLMLDGRKLLTLESVIGSVVLDLLLLQVQLVQLVK